MVAINITLIKDYFFLNKMEKLQQQIVSLLKSKQEDITINQVAEELSIDRHTAGKHLEALHTMGVAEYRSIGKSKVWKLTSSPLLAGIKKGSPITKEMAELFALLDDRVSIQNDTYDVLWSNKGTTNKKCYVVHANRESICINCPAEKSFKTGKSHSATCNKKNITTKPIKDDKNNTIAILEIVKEA